MVCGSKSLQECAVPKERHVLRQSTCEPLVCNRRQHGCEQDELLRLIRKTVRGISQSQALWRQEMAARGQEVRTRTQWFTEYTAVAPACVTWLFLRFAILDGASLMPFS